MKKSYQVEGLIWSWDRIPNFRSTAPISTIFKALEGEGSGGKVEGYGGRVWWKGMVEGGRVWWKGMVEGYGGRWKDGGRGNRRDFFLQMMIQDSKHKPCTMSV